MSRVMDGNTEGRRLRQEAAAFSFWTNSDRGRGERRFRETMNRSSIEAGQRRCWSRRLMHVAQKCAAVLGERHASKQELKARRVDPFQLDAL
ncbi:MULTISPECIES: hypothetical protein [unclassified Mesorhizobium]|uniref:hypothetical protein n=1 Tax=unclassified Mesorhizobium TaxID=325217 RepID=UPI00167355EE|nr:MULTISPECIES: hypothetical protein [unclassified Mesorhizobium]